MAKTGLWWEIHVFVTTWVSQSSQKFLACEKLVYRTCSVNCYCHWYTCSVAPWQLSVWIGYSNSQKLLAQSLLNWIYFATCVSEQQASLHSVHSVRVSDFYLINQKKSQITSLNTLIGLAPKKLIIIFSFKIFFHL